MTWFLRWRIHSADVDLIEKLSNGWTLKSHRFLDGQKQYKLYGFEGEEADIEWSQVQRLLRLKVISTNQKFPAATFLLTNQGQALAKSGARGIGSIVKFDS